MRKLETVLVLDIRQIEGEEMPYLKALGLNKYYITTKNNRFQRSIYAGNILKAFAYWEKDTRDLVNIYIKKV
jgi:hypothetical protein